MISKRNLTLSLAIVSMFFGVSVMDSHAQTRDARAFREYVNPDERVTFDRTTEFSRALDVINDFSQKAKGKIVLDRTGTSGSIDVTIPLMHWRDALDLILNVKGLALVEKSDYLEIVKNDTPGSVQNTSSGNQGQSTAAADEVIVTTKSREVRINAIFFEGNRRALQEIGVDWSTLTNDVPETVSDYVGNEGNEEFPTTEFDGPFVQVNSRGAQTVSQNVFNSLINLGDIGNTGIEIQALFSAFEADNLGEILSAPSIKVMEGQEGSIQIGQDFSIKQRDIAGNVMDEFVSVGTILTVTPQIFSVGDTTFIHLDIKAERSSAQPDPVSTVVNKTEGETQAILLDGETTVIAGLYRTEFSEVRRGIPILKDLPPWFFGLRYLFGYNSKDFLMRELIILVQASIEPTIPERFAKNNFPGKFDVLKTERDRMRDEMVEQKLKSSQTDDPASLDPDSDLQEKSKEPINQESVQAKDDPFASNAKSGTTNEQAENDDTTSKQLAYNRDPELKNEPIPLDFTSDDSYEVGVKEAEPDTKNPSEDEGPSNNNNSPNGGHPDIDNNQQQLTPSKSYAYYVIGGSFKNKHNATKLQNELIVEGFDAIIISRPGSDMHSVAYRGYNDLKKARKAVNDIKEYKNPNAWLYKLK